MAPVERNPKPCMQPLNFCCSSNTQVAVVCLTKPLLTLPWGICLQEGRKPLWVHLILNDCFSPKSLLLFPALERLAFSHRDRHSHGDVFCHDGFLDMSLGRLSRISLCAWTSPKLGILWIFHRCFFFCSYSFWPTHESKSLYWCSELSAPLPTRFSGLWIIRCSIYTALIISLLQEYFSILVLGLQKFQLGVIPPSFPLWTNPLEWGSLQPFLSFFI